MADERPVLFLCPLLDMGGAERHWTTLLPALRDRGLPVRLVALKAGGRSFDLLAEAGIPTRILGAKGGLASLAALPALLSERKHRPRAIVTWSLDAHVLGAGLARTLRVPQYVHWHRQPGLPMRGRERNGLRLVARTRANAVAVTEAQVPELLSFGFPADRVQIGLPGVPEPASAFASRADARAALGLPPDAFVPVLVARLRPEKRIDRFVEAVADVARRGRDVLGVVVGDGPEAASLAEHARRLEAPVRFVGYHAQPGEYMLASDAVCLTSEHEALPLTVLETLASGRPAVVMESGGMREVVHDRENGLVVAPGDVSGLADALEALAGDPQWASELGDRAHLDWSRHLSVDAMADAYRTLLAGRAS